MGKWEVCVACGELFNPGPDWEGSGLCDPCYLSLTEEDTSEDARWES